MKWLFLLVACAATAAIAQPLLNDGAPIPIRPALVDNGGWIGVRVQEVTPSIAESLNLSPARGALVASTTSGSAADKAGIKQGDVIETYNGYEIQTMRDLQIVVANTMPGQVVVVRIRRHSHQISATLTVAPRPNSDRERRAPSTPEVSGDQQHETEQKCREEGGNYSLCVNNALRVKLQCQSLERLARSDLTIIQHSMAKMHATAREVVDANIAGIAEWHPITGPYWAPYRNPISQADASQILSWAVEASGSMSPPNLGALVFNRCLSAR